MTDSQMIEAQRQTLVEQLLQSKRILQGTLRSGQPLSEHRSATRRNSRDDSRHWRKALRTTTSLPALADIRRIIASNLRIYRTTRRADTPDINDAARGLWRSL
jgi:hypothetical protein